MKSTKTLTAAYRMNEWSKRMSERTASGLSIKAYCEREGMAQNRYHYWQRKLRQAAAQELESGAKMGESEVQVAPTGLVQQGVPATQGLMITSDNEKQVQATPTGWVQVRSSEKKHENAGVTIEIGKCRVTATDDITNELLAKVCKVLVSLC